MSFFRQVRYRASRTRLRVPLIWYRHRGLNPKDVFISSYPRSGSTWLRFLLYEILTGNPAGFDGVNRVLADIGRQRVAPPLLPGRGRVLKTHEVYREEYKKAIYLVRDARDVAISEHAYEKALGRISGDFDDYLLSFVRGEVNPYDSWYNHVTGWLGSPLAKNGHLLVIRFEDMRQETEEALAQVTEFLGVRVEPHVIQNAVANNNVQRMRAQEDRSPQIDRSPGERDRFIRSGSVGGWRERLTGGQIQLIERYAGDVLARMGYPSGGSPTEKEEPTINVRH